MYVHRLTVSLSRRLYFLYLFWRKKKKKLFLTFYSNVKIFLKIVFYQNFVFIKKKEHFGIVFWSDLLGSCATPLGLGWDYKLPDSAFSASSEMSPGKE